LAVAIMTDNKQGIIEIYDDVFFQSLSDEPQIKLLSEREVYILLSVALFSGWQTRWYDGGHTLDLKAIRDKVVYNLMNDTEFCAIVASCIDNSETVQQAIENYLANNSTVIKNIQSAINRLDNINATSVANDNCDDRRWSGILRVVERLNTNNIDFLQYAGDQASDAFDRLEGLASGIPILGEFIELFGGDEVLEFIQQLAEDMTDEYENADTVALRESVACSIFCATDGCDITIDDVLNGYVALLPQGLIDVTVTAFVDIVSFVFAGTLVTTTYWAMVNIFQILALKLKSEFFGFEPQTFTIEYLRGSATPSSDHLLLCTCGAGCTLPITITFDSFSGACWTFEPYSREGGSATTGTPNTGGMTTPCLIGFKIERGSLDSYYNGGTVTFDEQTVVNRVSFRCGFRAVNRTAGVRVQIYADGFEVYNEVMTIDFNGENLQCDFDDVACTELQIITSNGSGSNLTNDIDNLMILRV
jgi:hypothetical protein